MPSPFPGMDPYLEAPGLWSDVHRQIISVLREVLQSQLRPKYFVRLEERVYVSDDDDPGREMHLPYVRFSGEDDSFRASRGSGESAVLDADGSVELVTFVRDEIHEPRLEVIDRLDKEVVTVLEVLSPSNKVTGSRGRESFVEKRQEVTWSSTHWIEIDLLREGVPFVHRDHLGPYDYSVHVSRTERRPRGTFYPIRLRNRLSRIAVPLKSEDPDTLLDLQKVLETAYDRAGYDMIVDYKTDPVPALKGDDAGWAESLLREKGLR